MKKLITFIVLLTYLSVLEAELTNNETPLKEIQVCIENFKDSLTERLREECNIYAYSGYGFNPTINELGKIEFIEMNFYVFMEATQDIARALELMILQKVTHALQNDEKIQPFLKEPTFNQLSLSIDFKNLDERRKIYHDRIGTVLSNLNTENQSQRYIEYISYNSSNEKKISSKESYEEALILNAVNLLTYTDLQDTFLINELFRLEKEHNLIVSSFLRSIDGYFKNPIDVHFYCQHLNQGFAITFEDAELSNNKILYTLEGTRFPPNKIYALYSLNINGEKKTWGNLKSNEQGELVT